MASMTMTGRRAACLVAAVLAAGGCGVVKFQSTTGPTAAAPTRGPMPANQKKPPRSVDGEKHASLVANDYSAAMAAAKAPPTDWEALVLAGGRARRCWGLTGQHGWRPEDTLTTTAGERTLAEIARECTQVAENLVKARPKGCWYRRLKLESVSLGGGAWSKPEAELIDIREDLPAVDRQFPQRSFNVGTPCKDTPAKQKGPPDVPLDVLKGACPRAGSFVVGRWQVQQNGLGAVTRSATAECWMNSELPETFIFAPPPVP